MASSKQLTVTATAQILIESYGENRRVIIHNAASHQCWLGGSDVSISNGYYLDKNTSLTLDVPIKSVIYAVTENAQTTTVSVLYLEP